MQQYVYTNQNVAKFDTVEATFTFTDVDGNQVEGKHSRCDLLELLETLGDVITQQFHSTKIFPSSWTNGIIDTSKPITIVITPMSAHK